MKRSFVVSRKRIAPFNPMSFLSRMEEGKDNLQYRRKEKVFLQGDPAD